MEQVLSGVRVIDVTNALAGSSATRMLAALGADVIKVEPPRNGEFARRLMPFMFEAHNRGKRSLTVDLSHPDGSGLARRLAMSSDVLVQSMRPGALEAFGLGADALAKTNPRLIYASFSAFGTEGPGQDRRGVDGVVQAESGLAVLQSGVLGHTSYVDTVAGLALSQGILAALMKRDRLGIVEPVEVSLLDAALYMQSATLAKFSATGVVADPSTYREEHPLVGLYEAADGWIYIAPYWEGDWISLCALLGREDLISDIRFADHAGRVRHSVHLRGELERSFLPGTCKDWVDSLESRGILAGVRRDPEAVLQDPQVAANKGVEEVQLSDGSSVSFPRLPIRLGGARIGSSDPSPQLGKDTEMLLDELGYAPAEVRRLRDLGVVTTVADERARL